MAYKYYIPIQPPGKTPVHRWTKLTGKKQQPKSGENNGKNIFEGNIKALNMDYYSVPKCCALL